MADDADRYHRQIRSEVERMGRMVDDLFELSRIQAGAFDLVPSEVALGDLVSDVIAGADPIARERGVRLGGSVTGDAVVLVDPARMSRVLLNLVSNAIRHTPADGAVQIIGHADEAGVELSVDDACGGIPDDELSRVFDVAWRGESARSPDAVGTGAGLGLAIVRGIVEAHRGSVDVQNHGSGCRFLVRIPAGSAHA